MFNPHHLTLERPIVGIRNQPGTHRILSHVLTIVIIALAVSNHAIEETALPNASAAGDGDSYNPLQPAHPLPELKIKCSLHKQMNMVRHDHVPTKRESASCAFLAI